MEQRFCLLVRDFLAELGGPGRGPVPAFRLEASLERDLGLGSLERVELLSRLENEFQVALRDEVMAEAETVSDLWRAICAGEGRAVAKGLAAAPATIPPPATPESATNLLEAFYLHCQTDAGRPHIYLRRDDGAEQTITYGELASRAAQVAADLRRRGVGAGDRVALMLPTGEDFFYSFMGILLAQAIPVPVYPPFRADRIEEFATRQSGILRNAEVCLLITFQRAETLARLLCPAVPSLAAVVAAEWDTRTALSPAWPPGAVCPGGGDRPALLQYTSGSTGNPKGVLLTHANLLANIRAIGEAAQVRPDDSIVCWLPLYHDMGLIGCWLSSLYFGLPITILSPLAFLSRPERWLWAIHSHRATLSPAPNFAYDLCARRIRDESIEGLDLSCWRVALNGSEGVLAETIARFSSRFACYGFRREAMLPVYGLAESTVGLCFPPAGRPPRVDRIHRDVFERRRRAEPAAGSDSALTFVSVGRPLAGHEVRVVDEVGQPVGERLEGRIQFRGPSCMAGYFRQPEATAAIQHGDWLDSGDLGYWADGELFVTGRSKDVILKAGRNLYPQEIEAVVAEIPGLRKGCVTAFGTADPAHGTEKLVVVAETRERSKAERDRLRREVNQRVMDLLGMPADEVILLGPGLLPKTSSGKLQRAACRQAYECGTIGQHRSAAWQWLRVGARWAGQSAARLAERASRFVYTIYFWSVFLLLLIGCWVTMLGARAGRPSANVLVFFDRLFFRVARLKINVEGLENLGAGPFMLVVNHASYLDAVILIAAIPRHFLFVAKKELLGTPIFGTFLRKIGHLIVDRYSVAEGVADAARMAKVLAGGSWVCVFPEGTFTRARGLRPFKLGAFKAAAEAGCPVLPVAVQGSRYVLPDETWMLRRGPIRVVIRPAIPPSGSGWREMVRLRNAAFAEILAHCGEPPLDIGSAAMPGRP